MGKLDPQLENIFAQAQEITDANGKLRFLKGACGGDETLRREGVAMLQVDQGAGYFMKAAPAVSPANAIPSVQAGKRIADDWLEQRKTPSLEPR